MGKPKILQSIDDINGQLDDIAINVKNFGASGSRQTFIGSANAGSNILTLTVQGDFVIGQGIAITGAGNTQGYHITKVTAINGSQLTLQDNVVNTVNGVVIWHDDTEAIRSAINTGKNILFPFGQYVVSSTINIPSGTKLIGNGLNLDNPNFQTKILRIVNSTIFNAIGGKILNSGAHTNFNWFKGIMFDGCNKGTDMLHIECANFVYFIECSFSSCYGRALNMIEVFDSRFIRCNADHVGSSDGSLPGIELQSGINGYEYTNQIHFTNCDFESYYGTMLAMTGNNTNEIFFDHCKLESIISNQKHISITNATVIHFNGLQICSMGNAGNTIDSQIYVNSSSLIIGTIFCEHTGNVNSIAALTQFLHFVSCSNIQVDIYPYDVSKISGNYIVYFENCDGNSCEVRGILTKTQMTTNNKLLSNLNGANIQNSIILNGKNGFYPRTIYVNVDIPGFYELGDVQADVNGKPMFQLQRNDGSSQGLVYRIDGNGNWNFYTPIVPLKNSGDPANMPANGIFVDTSNSSLRMLRFNTNGVNQGIGWSNVIPTTGTFRTGDIIYNSAPSIGNPKGWVCTLSGTPGTWVSMGNL